MSIIEIIRERCSEGELFPVNPLLSSDPISRGLFVTAEVHQMLSDNMDSDPVWGRTRAVMDTFVSGRLISVGHKKTHLMAQMKPRKNWSVWTMRVTGPNPPGLRILGQFAAKDVFIALEWRERFDLKDFQSREWQNAIRNCKAKWRGLFYNYHPLDGENMYGYVSNIIIS